jgi:hypothetical protein
MVQILICQLSSFSKFLRYLSVIPMFSVRSIVRNRLNNIDFINLTSYYLLIYFVPAIDVSLFT